MALGMQPNICVTAFRYGAGKLILKRFVIPVYCLFCLVLMFFIAGAAEDAHMGAVPFFIIAMVGFGIGFFIFTRIYKLADSLDFICSVCNSHIKSETQCPICGAEVGKPFTPKAPPPPSQNPQ